MDKSFQLLWELDHMVRVKFNLQICQTASKVAVPLCVPILAMDKRFCCFTSLSALGVVNILDFGHFRRYTLVSQCCFYLHFLMMMWNTFSYSYLPSIYSLLWIILLWFWCILKLDYLFSFCGVLKFFLYFRKQSLSDVFLHTFFSHSMACLWIFLTLFFPKQKF